MDKKWVIVRLAGDDDTILVREYPDDVQIGHWGNIARANLIAAAPELLSALKAAKVYVDIFFQDRAVRTPVQGAIDTAIAKAEGR